jgi:hypothetical protein
MASQIVYALPARESFCSNPDLLADVCAGIRGSPDPRERSRRGRRQVEGADCMTSIRNIFRSPAAALCALLLASPAFSANYPHELV